MAKLLYKHFTFTDRVKAVVLATLLVRCYCSWFQGEWTLKTLLLSANFIMNGKLTGSKVFFLISFGVKFLQTFMPVKILLSTKAEGTRHYQHKFVEEMIFGHLQQLLEH